MKTHYTLPTLGEVATAFAKSNGWDFAYALGYVSGLDDAKNAQLPDHDLEESDDYAMGYHKGYATM